MYGSFWSDEDLPLCPVPSGIVLEAGAFREALSISDAAALLKVITDESQDARVL